MPILISCSEQKAMNITVNFPQLSGKDARRSVSKVYIPDGTNGAGNLAAYDPTMDTPYTTIAQGNVAVLKLASPIPFDGGKIFKFERANCNF